MSELFTRPIIAREIIVNPSWKQLREWAQIEETTTTFGSARYISRIRNRSAAFTEVVFGEPSSEQRRWLEELPPFLETDRLIQLDRIMGQNPNFSLHCRLYIPVDFARMAYMWGQSLFDAPAEYYTRPTADLTTIIYPKWRDKLIERKVLVDPNSFTTYILGSDYMGEIKKSFLRMAMYWVKKQGGLGLHAGSKLLRVHNANNELVEKGVIFFGLSGTGKSTLTCHHHFLAGPGEGVSIRQDDVVMMQADASCYGTENNFYIKTEGLEKEGQPILYDATVAPEAMLENVWVDANGEVDFLNYTIGRNGRAMVRRADMAYTDDNIDLPRADIVVFITRREDIVPAVARLTPAQGGAMFVLGESIETAAGDPAKAGQPVHSVGTNPFIIGPQGEEGNIFMRFMKANPDVQVFLLNTGSIGLRGIDRQPRMGVDGKPLGAKVKILDSTELIKQMARGGIRWEKDPDWNYEVAVEVEGLPDYKERLDPRRYYTPEDYATLTQILKEDRQAWLAKFPELDPEIPASLGL